jgi:hypothetical protein
MSPAGLLYFKTFAFTYSKRKHISVVPLLLRQNRVNFFYIYNFSFQGYLC